MDVLLRELIQGAGGFAEYRDVEVTTEAVTIGSAADRTIQLLGASVAGDHAEITQHRAETRIVCSRGHTVMVGDQPVRSETLVPGSTVGIGKHRLTIIDAPVGFDLAIQIEVDNTIDAGVFESAFRTDLDQLPISNRTIAWLLTAVIIVAGFVLPLQQAGSDNGAEDRTGLIPTDELWSSGPLHPAHDLAIGERCDACHQTFFQRVKDASCLECHEKIVDHVETDRLASMPLLGDTPRCASCHLEHNEPNPHLIVRADALCTDCHDDAERLFGMQSVASVHGFSVEMHPEFAAHLIKPVLKLAGTGIVFEWETTVENVGVASEVSNLKFPHSTHLDPELVSTPNSGAALGCNDCHKLSLDREHFVPVTMDSVCIDCHELTFDTQMPDRQLPHGQPLEVMIALEGQYLRNFSSPDVPQEAIVRRRLPDRPPEEPDCVNTAFACATAAATIAINEQFTVRGCVSCHIVEDHGGNDTYARYQVFPVRLTTDYFPAGRFDHYSHQIMKQDTGDDACMYCHLASESESSSDLLMPDIDVCVDCHSDQPEPDHVRLQCIDCHSYHPFSGAYTPTLEANTR